MIDTNALALVAIAVLPATVTAAATVLLGRTHDRREAARTETELIIVRERERAEDLRQHRARLHARLLDSYSVVAGFVAEEIGLLSDAIRVPRRSGDDWRDSLTETRRDAQNRTTMILWTMGSRDVVMLYEEFTDCAHGLRTIIDVRNHLLTDNPNSNLAREHWDDALFQIKILRERGEALRIQIRNELINEKTLT